MCAEFNFAADPEAAHVVLNELNRHIIVFPWDINTTLSAGQTWVCFQNSLIVVRYYIVYFVLVQVGEKCIYNLQECIFVLFLKTII